MPRKRREFHYVADRKWLRVFRTTAPAIRLVESSDSEPEADPLSDFVFGAQWWLCRSDKNRKELMKLFDIGEVAGVLYERVGAILELGVVSHQYLMAIQLVRYGSEFHDWDLDLCLQETGIYVDELYEDPHE